jgi:hypothetical protein
MNLSPCLEGGCAEWDVEPVTLFGCAVGERNGEPVTQFGCRDDEPVTLSIEFVEGETMNLSPCGRDVDVDGRNCHWPFGCEVRPAVRHGVTTARGMGAGAAGVGAGGNFLPFPVRHG